jgi:hypothetical protein
MAAICLVFSGWLAYGSVVLNTPGLRIPKRQFVDLTGIGAEVTDEDEEPRELGPETRFQKWKRLSLDWIKEWGNKVLYYV